MQTVNLRIYLVHHMPHLRYILQLENNSYEQFIIAYNYVLNIRVDIKY